MNKQLNDKVAKVYHRLRKEQRSKKLAVLKIETNLQLTKLLEDQDLPSQIVS